MNAEPSAGEAPESRPGSRWSNLSLRLATAAVVVPVLLGLLFAAPSWAFPLLVAGAVGVAGWELASMTVPGSSLQMGWMVVASMGVFAGVYFDPGPGPWLPTVLIGLAAGGGMLGLAAAVEPEAAGTRTGWLIGGPAYAGGLLATLALLHQGPQGGGWVLLAMAIAWLGDTAAYFVGRSVGRRKLLERVSPKKTVEGSIGGLVGSVLGALAVQTYFLPTIPPLHLVALAFGAAACGQAGDLVMSVVKRGARVKDTGHLVPGHGGLLDRIDALVMTSVVTWLYRAWWVTPM